jgi:hypothetical protein
MRRSMAERRERSAGWQSQCGGSCFSASAAIVRIDPQVEHLQTSFRPNASAAPIGSQEPFWSANLTLPLHLWQSVALVGCHTALLMVEQEGIEPSACRWFTGP